MLKILEENFLLENLMIHRGKKKYPRMKSFTINVKDMATLPPIVITKNINLKEKTRRQ